MRPTLTLLLLSLGAVWGCVPARSDVPPLDAGCPDASCCPAPSRALDLLLVVDNSDSMDGEQARLAAAVPLLLSGLATGDLDGDGVRDARPMDDVHFGVVTSDMGVGGFDIPTCSLPFGDDGELQTTSGAGFPHCALVYPAFLEYGAGGPTDLTPLSADFACVLSAGVSGCGFEQPLEAALKALTPATSALRFSRGTTGHGDGVNAGFRRPGAALAVLVFTDEDDCSVRPDAEDFFDMSSTAYPGEPLRRCVSAKEPQTPSVRYVDGLLAVEPNPARLVFAAIAGVPMDVGSLSYDALLLDPRMIETIDPGPMGNGRILPSCVGGFEGAFPARRIVSTARDLAARGAQTTVQSICAETYIPAVTAILTAIDRAASACE